MKRSVGAELALVVGLLLAQGCSSEGGPFRSAPSEVPACRPEAGMRWCSRSCEAPEAELADAELLGFAAIVQRADVDEYIFDADARPYFRVSTLPPELAPRFADAEGQVELHVRERVAAGAHTLVFLSVPSISPGRSGVLSFGARRWNVAFTHRPGDWPSLAPVRALKDARRYDEALAALDGAPLAHPVEALQARVERAAILRRMDDLDGYARALGAWEEEARARGVPTAQTQALRAQAFMAFYRRDFAPVLPLLERAKSIDRVIGNPSGLVRASAYETMVARELGQYRLAMQTAEEGRAIAESYGLSEDAATQTKVIASLWSALGQYERALGELDRVAERFTRGDLKAHAAGFFLDRGWTLALGMSAGVIDVDWSRPRADFEAAYAHARDHADRGAETNARTNLLWIAELTGNPEEVATRLSALERGRTVQVRSERGASMAAGGRDAVVLEALDLTKHSYAKVFAARVRGSIELRDGRLDDAQRSFERALAMARREANEAASDGTWRALHGLGRVERARARADRSGPLPARCQDGARRPGCGGSRGEMRRASERFSEALEVVDRLARQTELRETRATFTADRAELVDDAIETFVARGRTWDALAVAERARSHVFRPLATRAALESLSIEARLAWRAQMDVYSSLREAFEKRAREEELVGGAELAAFRRETARVRKALEAQFDAAYAVIEGGTAAAERTDPTAQIQRIKSALGPSGALVYFHASRRGFETFYVTGDGIEHAVLPTPSVTRWGRDLVRRAHLYVVSASPVLVLGGPDALRRLLETTGVSVLPWAGLITRAPASDPASGGALVVADPESNLPHARREGSMAAAKLSPVVTLVGPDATRQRVLAALQTASQFHFSGHGQLDPRDPWDARLNLAAGEALSLDDILVEGLRPRRVVLSGCETGRAGSLSKNLQIGLPDAFLLVGAETVVGTIRPIADEDAERFMKRFYEEGGASNPVEAYRKTALALAAVGDDAWTAFQVAGTRR